VLDEEIGEAMEISSVSCRRYSPGDTVEGTFYDFTIYLAHSDVDQLSSQFDANWIEGTREMVFYRDSLTLSNSPDDWVEFILDSQYWYNGSDNLVLEFLWSDAVTNQSCMYSWHWESGAIRSITGEYQDSTGTMSSLVLMIMLNGDMSLPTITFGSLKAHFFEAGL